MKTLIEQLQEANAEITELKKNSIQEVVENENGTAIKYANGIMKCYSLVRTENYSTDLCVSTAVWTFPVKFAGDVQDIFVYASPGGSNDLAYITQCNRESLTRAVIKLKAMSANSTSNYTNSEGRGIFVMAIGKWK